ncbi:hypothetical protein H8356DRAFT_1032715 [Neocallimastix lanati (nom. inval.)]|nr:hypothetical protein H8356DRAFT_1032715 [Neocallimastix sp. JGI-2020a]
MKEKLDISRNSMINNQLYMEMQNKDVYGEENNRSSLNNSFFQFNNLEILSYSMIFDNEIKSLKQLKILFKKSLNLIDELDDPLDVFNSYIQWLQLNYQSIENFSIEDEVIPIIMQALKLLNGDPRYVNDIRYLRFWVIYSSFVDDPISIFEFLEKNNLCLKLAAYYEEFSKLKEIEKRFDEAKKIYHLGLKRKARPFLRLKRNYEALKKRMEFINQHQDNEIYRSKNNNINNKDTINNKKDITIDTKNKIKNLDFEEMQYNSIDYLNNNYNYSNDESSNEEEELQLSDLNVIEHEIESESNQKSINKNSEDSTPVLRNESIIVNNIEIENNFAKDNSSSVLYNSNNNSKLKSINKNSINNNNMSLSRDKNIIKIGTKKLSLNLSYSQYKYLLNNQWNYLKCKVYDYKGERISYEELRAIINGYSLNVDESMEQSSIVNPSDVDMDIDQEDNDEKFEEIFTNISTNISKNSKNSRHVTPDKRRNLKHLEDTPTPVYVDNDTLKKYSQRQDTINDDGDGAIPVYQNNNQSKDGSIDSASSLFPSVYKFNEDKNISPSSLNIKNGKNQNYTDIIRNKKSRNEKEEEYTDRVIIDKLKSSIDDLDRNVNHIKETINSINDHDSKIRHSETNSILRSTVNSIFKPKENEVDDSLDSDVYIYDANEEQNDYTHITPKNLIKVVDLQSSIKAKKNRVRRNSQLALTMKNKEKFNRKSDIMDEIYRREKEGYDNEDDDDNIYNSNHYHYATPTNNQHQELDSISPTYIQYTKNKEYRREEVDKNKSKYNNNSNNNMDDKENHPRKSLVRSINNNINNSNKNDNYFYNRTIDLNQSMENLKLSSSLPYREESEGDENVSNSSDGENIISHFSSVKKPIQGTVISHQSYDDEYSSSNLKFSQNLTDISPRRSTNKKDRKLRTSAIISNSLYPSGNSNNNNNIVLRKNNYAIMDIETSNPYIDRKFNDITDEYFKNLIKEINNATINNKAVDYTKRPEFLKLKCIIEDYTRATGNAVRNPSPTLLEDEIKKGISYVFYENNSCKVIKEIGRGEFSKIYLVGLNSLDDELSSVDQYNPSSTTAISNGDRNSLVGSTSHKMRLSLPMNTKRIKLALKIQHNAINSMEYYNIQKLHQRVQSNESMNSSFVKVKQLYKYKNACHILMEYCEFGSLLEALNYQFCIQSDISSNAAMTNTYDTLLNHSIKNISSALNRAQVKGTSHRRSRSRNTINTSTNATSAGITGNSGSGLGSESRERIQQCILSSAMDYDGLDESRKIHEVLVIFYTIEILKMVETLHQSNIIHSDIKIDNFMLRMPLIESYKNYIYDDKELCSPRYCTEGQQGWNNYGLTLIDFGQSIDLTDFTSEGNLWFRQTLSEYQSTTKNTTSDALNMNSSIHLSRKKSIGRRSTSRSRSATTSTSIYDKNQGNHCWEIRHHQPYLYEIDWYGVAGVIHALLFNEYMEIEEEEEEEEENTTYLHDKEKNNRYNDDDDDDDDGEEYPPYENYSSSRSNYETYTIYDYSGQNKKPIKKTVYPSSSTSSPSPSSIFNKKKPHLRITKTFKRYWQRELWQRLFDVLLNAKTVNSDLTLDSLTLYTPSTLPNNNTSTTSTNKQFSPSSSSQRFYSSTATATTTTSTSTPTPSSLTDFNKYYEQRFPKIHEIRKIRQEFESWLTQHDRSSQYHLLGYLRLLSAQCIAINKF